MYILCITLKKTILFITHFYDENEDKPSGKNEKRKLKVWLAQHLAMLPSFLS